MTAPDLPAFLLARITEDETAASGAIRAHEDAVAACQSSIPVEERDSPAQWEGGTNEDGNSDYWCGVWAGGGWVSILRMDSEYDSDTAAHIARQDPARVLADCAAKRRLVAWALAHPLSCAEVHPGFDVWHPDGHDHPVLRMLAAPFADQPGWRVEWRVED